MTPSLIELNKILAALYFDVGLSQGVIYRAGLPRETIDWSGKATNFWYFILKEAARQEAALKKLVEAVTAEYPNKKDLIEECYQNYLTQIRNSPANTPEAVVAGLNALVELLKLPTIRQTLRSYRDNLQTISDQITEISNYKDLHDLLHELQLHCFDPINQIIRRSSYDENDWYDVSNHEITFQGVIDSIEEISDRRTYEKIKMPRILDPLRQARELLQEAVEKNNQIKLNESVFAMSRVLSVQPPRINIELNNASKQLRLARLVEALAIVRNKVIERMDSDEIKVAEVSLFVSGVDSLDSLNQCLNGLIAVHDTLQIIDSDLRQIEPNLEKDSGDLKLFWPGIEEESAKLSAAENGGSWVERLTGVIRELGEALAADDRTQILRAFQHFRRLIADRFFRVDKSLKNSCDELSRIGSTPLDAVNQALLEAINEDE